MSEEALHIAEHRREAKGKGERERHAQLNAEFQRIERRHKKALSEQGKETEESNKIRKTRSLQENWRYQGTFQAKMSTIKDRNGKDLTKVEKIKILTKFYQPVKALIPILLKFLQVFKERMLSNSFYEAAVP